VPAQVAVVLFAQAALPIDPVQIEIIRMLGTGYVAASVSMLALKVPTSKASLTPCHLVKFHFSECCGTQLLGCGTASLIVS
jgi:hypothetical protein